MTRWIRIPAARIDDDEYRSAIDADRVTVVSIRRGLIDPLDTNNRMTIVKVSGPFGYEDSFAFAAERRAEQFAADLTEGAL